MWKFGEGKWRGIDVWQVLLLGIGEIVVLSSFCLPMSLLCPDGILGLVRGHFCRCLV